MCMEYQKTIQKQYKSSSISDQTYIYVTRSTSNLDWVASCRGETIRDAASRSYLTLTIYFCSGCFITRGDAMCNKPNILLESHVKSLHEWSEDCGCASRMGTCVELQGKCSRSACGTKGTGTRKRCFLQYNAAQI
jgi:hypothetical protein